MAVPSTGNNTTIGLNTLFVCFFFYVAPLSLSQPSAFLKQLVCCHSFPLLDLPKKNEDRERNKG